VFIRGSRLTRPVLKHLDLRRRDTTEGITIWGSGSNDALYYLLPSQRMTTLTAYKTSRRLPPQSAIDRDLQLSMYHLAAKEVWGIEPERLTLYYLLPGRRMTTTRSGADVDDLRRRIATVAERIEAGKFEPHQNPLCDWCEYQRLCPLFRHQYEKQEGDPAPRPLTANREGDEGGGERLDRPPAPLRHQHGGSLARGELTSPSADFTVAAEWTRGGIGVG
jgi:hypothetical protein